MVSSNILVSIFALLFVFSTWPVAADSVSNPAPGAYIRYKDPKQPIGARINDLMSRMTLEEKIGQMSQIERMNATPALLRDYGVGSVLSGGGSAPRLHATPEVWVDMINNLQQNGSLASRLGIPMIYGIDAIHGQNNVYQATIFPHNVGLGCTSN